jgi:adenine-specific DNA-methyltransferase
MEKNMEKMKMRSPNLTRENMRKIMELFPNCVTEAEDVSADYADERRLKTEKEIGENRRNLRMKIDFDLLRQELSESIVEGPQERYQLNWPGKREALLTANAPIAKILRPCRDESVDFDTTKNLFIEGNNLDALKLLQETYLGKVKMIYIDPPYNTGNDFIYEDDFAEKSEDFLKRSNQKDEAGNRLVANTEANGRFHSDWLSMIYPRLKLARNLLSDDGVIFISIDDNEVANLRKACDEIFGEQNFIAQIVWKKRSTPPNDRIIAAQHEYILCITKNSNNPGLNLRPRNKEQIDRYKNPDNHPKGPWTAGDLMANVKGGRYVASLYYPIVNPRTGQEHYPSSGGNWRFNKDRIAQLIKDNEIYFGEDDQGRPKLKRFLCDVKEGITWTTLWDFSPLNTVGSTEMTNIFGNLTTFENPKPTGLILDTLRAGSTQDSIILDFFAGSATTAHAVMQLNAEDGGNRKFIMVQLPEPCGEQSEAFKAGYKTIAEIGKERIRRAGKKISADYAEKRRLKEKEESENLFSKAGPKNNLRKSAQSADKELDIGFRVLKIDSSNMAEVYYTPDAIEQDQLNIFTDNIMSDRKPEDLLFQVLLDWGVDLSLPIRKERIHPRITQMNADSKPEKNNLQKSAQSADKKSFEVFFVDENSLVACFDTGVNEDLVKELARFEPLRAVFRDTGFVSDAVKINAEQIFKQMSPHTEVRSI